MTRDRAPESAGKRAAWRVSGDEGLVELIIGKQRNGPIVTVELRFTGDLMKFESFVEAAQYEAAREG